MTLQISPIEFKKKISEKFIELKIVMVRLTITALLPQVLSQAVWLKFVYCKGGWFGTNFNFDLFTEIECLEIGNCFLNFNGHFWISDLHYRVPPEKLTEYYSNFQNKMFQVPRT